MPVTRFSFRPAAGPWLARGGLIALVGLSVSCGGGSEVAAAAAPTVAAAPQDACTVQQALRRYGQVPPPRYSAILAWANAMTGSGVQPPTETARVEVDYIRLLEVDPTTGAITTVTEGSEEYTVPRPSLSVNEGNLYPRLPPCAPGASLVEIGSSSVNDGVLTIDLAGIADKVAHWWTPQGTLMPGRRYLVESRFRVSGNGYIQFGIDYWRGRKLPFKGYDETCQTSNNCEGWVSDWFGDTGGQFVVQRVPVL